jgi:hypothetical protein
MAEPTEREWWAILVDAECRAEKGDMASHNLANRARYALVKKFGLNLDTVWDRARPQFLQMLGEEEDKLKEEEAMRKRTEELLASSPPK